MRREEEGPRCEAPAREWRSLAEDVGHGRRVHGLRWWRLGALLLPRELENECAGLR